MNLEQKKEYALSLAQEIAEDITSSITRYSTVSIERATLRLYGVDGADENGIPLCNVFQSVIPDISNGLLLPFLCAQNQYKCDPNETVLRVVSEGFTDVDFDCPYPHIEPVTTAGHHIMNMDTPAKYVIVATGNIYEDLKQAEAAVYSGADIIAVIRSTAQSLYDYVPHGVTTEGYGGTFATQANFRLMREHLDSLEPKVGRKLMLTNYASGLCMPEITVCAIQEHLDLLLNDSMYGILFRDINPVRTFCDQHFSRRLCGQSGIVINTGEDNYLTTSDALEAAHTVTCSQLINHQLANIQGIPLCQQGLGHAFEIDPSVPDSLLHEIAHASLTKFLFPECPVKYMPPTKYKGQNIFRAHALDTMYNLVSVLTGQKIHLVGMLTEGIHTPLLQDRCISLDSVDYVSTAAHSLHQAISYNSLVTSKIDYVLSRACELLETVKSVGMYTALSEGLFAGINRPKNSGKGLEGVFEKGSNYFNPFN